MDGRLCPVVGIAVAKRDGDHRRGRRTVGPNPLRDTRKPGERDRHVGCLPDAPAAAGGGFTYVALATLALGTAVALVASWVPTRREARVDQTSALRHD